MKSNQPLFLLAFFICFLGLSCVNSTNNKNDKSVNKHSTSFINKRIQLIVNEINKNCPQILNSDIIWENVVNTSTPNNPEITYFYRYKNLVNPEIACNEDNIQGTRSAAINSIKTMPTLKFYRENKVNFNFIYRDKNGNYVNEIKINYVDYSK